MLNKKKTKKYIIRESVVVPSASSASFDEFLQFILFGRLVIHSSTAGLFLDQGHLSWENTLKGKPIKIFLASCRV
jgi:hypothetical protein